MYQAMRETLRMHEVMQDRVELLLAKEVLQVSYFPNAVQEPPPSAVSKSRRSLGLRDFLKSAQVELQLLTRLVQCSPSGG